MNRKHIIITIIVLISYLLINYGLPPFIRSLTIEPFWFKKLLFYFLQLSVAAIGLFIIHQRVNKLLAAWGIQSGFLRGLYFAFLMTLPMLIGYAIASQFQMNLAFDRILYSVLIAPILEELLYRGFLFGQLYRYAGWGFIPAGLLNAVIFSAGHLYQANSFGSAIGVLAVTAMGGMWFAWLYIEWNNQLWISIFLHLFMNAWWTIFETSSNAAGDVYANIFRGLTIAASIIITVRMAKKRGGLRITRRQLWVNRATEVNY